MWAAPRDCCGAARRPRDGLRGAMAGVRGRPPRTAPLCAHSRLPGRKGHQRTTCLFPTEGRKGKAASLCDPGGARNPGIEQGRRSPECLGPAGGRATGDPQVLPDPSGRAGSPLGRTPPLPSFWGGRVPGFARQCLNY